MRRLAVLGIICFTFHALLFAQAPPKGEIFGGYSLLHDGVAVPSNYNGWDFAPTVYLNRWLGTTAEFTGHYSTQTVPALGTNLFSQTRIYTFMFGPHFVYRKSRYSLFAQPLAGVNYTNFKESALTTATCGTSTCVSLGAPFSDTYNSFSMAFGGGVDIELGHSVAFRPVQVEYIMRRVSGADYGQTRFTTGLIFRPHKPRPRHRNKKDIPPPPAMRR